MQVLEYFLNMWIKIGNYYLNINLLVSLQKVGVNNYTATFLGLNPFTNLTLAQIQPIIAVIDAGNNNP